MFLFLFTDMSSIIFHAVCVEWSFWHQWKSSETAKCTAPIQGLYVCHICIPIGNECVYFILGSNGNRSRTRITKVVRCILPHVSEQSLVPNLFPLFENKSFFPKTKSNVSLFFIAVGWTMYYIQMWPFSFYWKCLLHSENIQAAAKVLKVYSFSTFATSSGF